MKEYERLTKKDSYYDKDDHELDLVIALDKCHHEEVQDIDIICDKLNRLAELEDDLESGKLVRLPCRVGDMVYCIYHFFDVEEDFEYDIIPEEVVDIIVQEDDFDIGTACRMIGKFKRVYVCLTKAEAEARLKELQEKQK